MIISYAVFDRNTGRRRYYDGLSEAVQRLKVVYNYPMLDIDTLDYNRDYYAQIRFGIDNGALPLALKSSSLWENNRNMQSDWCEWDIEGPES